MQRQADERFDALEAAVTHGVANVMVKGRAEQRRRERARQRTPMPAGSTDGSWARQMAADFPGMVVVPQPSPDGPLAIGFVP